MEYRGTIPQGAVDVSNLAELLRRPGPVATVALPTPAAVDRASARDELRWQDLRGGLEEAGAPPEALTAVDAVVPDAHRAGEGLFVAADASGALLVRHSPVPPRATLARWDTLASVGTLVDWRQHQPAYLVALVDHRGADLVVSGGEVADRTVEAGDVGGYPLERNAPGGWSQRRYQQHALENWSANAADVAATMTDLAAEVDPAVVIVAGDPRARSLLLEHLPRDLQDRLAEVSGSRAADGGGDQTAREVARAVGTATASRPVALLQEWRQQLGRGDRATDGVDATMDALRRGQVAVLLVHDDPGDDRRAWFGDEPGLVATERAELEGVAGGPVGEGRLVDVAIRAAATTSAAVAMVPDAGGPTAGLGALLRWS